MEEYINIFNNYIKNFDMNNHKISHKYEHTFRVVSYAEKIAKSLNLNDDDINEAKKCALFHDIGRFQQATIYDTFDDLVSIDHGDLGAEILKELNINDDITITATRYHNKYSIPDNLDDRTKLFCNITRDADKLDILFMPFAISDAKEIINDRVYEMMLDKKLLKMELIHNSSERILKSLSFIYDINYILSFKIIYDSNIINTMINELNTIYNEPKLEKIRNVLNDYVKGKIDNVK